MKSTIVNNNIRSGGVGFCGLLTILFIALKLIGYITWSWLWVLSPLWIGLAVVFVIWAFIFVIALIFLIAMNRH
jgi:hypothetical protein